MKGSVFGILWITLVVECGYIVLSRLVLHATWGHLTQPLVFLGLFGLFAASHGNVRWIAPLPRLVIAAEFLLSVADRFGLFGPPGKGVSWGDFAHFVAYTHRVNAFLPASFAPTLAVLATIGEITFGITLLLGFRIRLYCAWRSHLAPTLQQCHDAFGFDRISVLLRCVRARSGCVGYFDDRDLLAERGWLDVGVIVMCPDLSCLSWKWRKRSSGANG